MVDWTSMHDYVRGGPAVDLLDPVTNQVELPVWCKNISQCTNPWRSFYYWMRYFRLTCVKAYVALKATIFRGDVIAFLRLHDIDPANDTFRYVFSQEDNIDPSIVYLEDENENGDPKYAIMVPYQDVFRANVDIGWPITVILALAILLHDTVPEVRAEGVEGIVEYDKLSAFVNWYYHSINPETRAQLEFWNNDESLATMPLNQAVAILSRIPPEPRKVFKVFLGSNTNKQYVN